MWQAQSWYPQLLQMAVKTLSSSTKVAQSIDRYNSGKSCISRKRKLTAPAMDSFREKLSLEGLPKEYVSLITITNTRRKGTIPQLVSQERLILLNCHLKNIFDFLTDCFEEGYEFNTIADFRSAISFCLLWSSSGSGSGTKLYSLCSSLRYF